MERLYLDGNADLGGELSSFIGEMELLTSIRLGGTKVGGTIPDRMFALPVIEEIDFTGATFSGTLSESFSELSESLRRLKLSDNDFAGSIPTAFDSLTMLSKLFIHRQHVTIGR